MGLKDESEGILAVVDAGHRELFAKTFFGSLLGQALVLLAMIVTYMAAFALVWQKFSKDLTDLRQLSGEFAFWGLLLLPMLFIIAFSLVPTAVRGWRERELRRISIAPGDRDASLFRLRPYAMEDRDQYVRPDGADRRAFAWLNASDKSLLYLFGASGSGKSSLLAASIVPQLEALGWMSLSVRVDNAPGTRLREALLEAPKLFSKAPPKTTPLFGLLERASADRERNGRAPLLVIIDQFEEFLILNDDDARAPLIDLLSSLEARPLAGVRVLCVCRSDYRELLFKLDLPPYIPAANSFELAPFTRTEAEGFLRRGGRVLSADAYDALFTGLDRIEQTPGLYRPITLNMVGLVLERMGGRIEGDPARLIDQYLRNCLAEGKSRDFAASVLSFMITGSGTKEPRDVKTLTALARVQTWQVTSTLTELEEDGLVRPLNAERTRWEISHDFLARQIGMLLGRLRLAWIRRAAPIVLPSSALAWVAGLFLVLVYLPQLREQDALSALRAVGFYQMFMDGREVLSLSTGDDQQPDESLALLASRAPALRNLSALDLSVLSEITSLAPLKGMKLDWLNLSGVSEIDSLEPLRDMPLTSLNLSQAYRITSLEPLRGSPLTQLDISGITVKDLGPLRGMPLKSLKMGGTTDLDSLEVLQGMPLVELDISDTRVKDLGPLRGMPLKSLNLDRALNIASLEPLRAMPLETLSINGASRIQSLAPLQGIALTDLDLSYVEKILDIEPLRGMPLESLKLDGASSIVSLAPLEGMPLTSLSMSGAAIIESLDPLQGMALTHLDLSSSPNIKDLEPLRGMPLESLSLAGTASITSLEPLRGMRFTSLDLSGMTGLTSLEGLEEMPLTELDISGTGTANLEPLRGMQLTSLNLSDTRLLVSLEPLREMPLEAIYLSGASKIESLEPLRGKRFSSLYLSGMTGLASLEGLQGMSLTELDISGNVGITSLEPLRGMQLTSLDLSNVTSITSLEPLRGMPLESLSIVGNKAIESLDPVAGLPKDAITGP